MFISNGNEMKTNNINGVLFYFFFYCDERSYAELVEAQQFIWGANEKKNYYINVLCAWIQNRDKWKKKPQHIHCPLLVRLVWILTFFLLLLTCFSSSHFSFSSLVHVGQLSLTSLYSNNVHLSFSTNWNEKALKFVFN